MDFKRIFIIISICCLLIVSLFMLFILFSFKPRCECSYPEYYLDSDYDMTEIKTNFLADLNTECKQRDLNDEEITTYIRKYKTTKNADGLQSSKLYIKSEGIKKIKQIFVPINDSQISISCYPLRGKTVFRDIDGNILRCGCGI